jgi:uncharacterized membrane protein YfcA
MRIAKEANEPPAQMQRAVRTLPAGIRYGAAALLLVALLAIAAHRGGLVGGGMASAIETIRMERSAHAVVVLAACAIFIAALVSSIAGFAFSALAGAPLLFLLADPLRTVATMVLCSIAIQGYCVFALRRSVEWPLLWPFLAGGIVTVPAGVWLLSRTPAKTFALVLGIVVIAYTLCMIARRRPVALRAGRACDVVAGALGGFTGGLAAFPGCFVTIWCGVRGWSKERQRAVYQPFILAMQIEALLVLGIHDSQAIVLEDALVYVPVALVAASLGFALFRRLTNRQFSIAVHALLLVSGAALVTGAM